MVLDSGIFFYDRFRAYTILSFIKIEIKQEIEFYSTQLDRPKNNQIRDCYPADN